MLIGRSVFPSPCGRSPRADEVMAFGRRTVTMSFSGLRLIFTIGGGGVWAGLRLLSRAGRSLRQRRPATALSLRLRALRRLRPTVANRRDRRQRSGFCQRRI